MTFITKRMKTLVFIYLCALLSCVAANINDLTGDDLTMYDCVVQYKNFLHQKLIDKT